MNENEVKDGRGKPLPYAKIFVGMVLAFVLIRVPVAFPEIRSNHGTITLFSVDRMVAMHPGLNRRPSYRFEGMVLGTHVLRTSHGDITLGNSARIISDNNTVARISVENFMEGLASHNLVVEGMEMPRYITVVFATGNPQTARHHNVSSLLIGMQQEVIVSDIPLRISRLHLSAPGETADIVMNVDQSPEDITLADSTKIQPSSGRFDFLMYKDRVGFVERWVLWNQLSPIYAKLPGETEFARYQSITFRPNWGEFIEGEPFVERDHRADSERDRAMLRASQQMIMNRRR